MNYLLRTSTTFTAADDPAARTMMTDKGALAEAVAEFGVKLKQLGFPIHIKLQRLNSNSQPQEVWSWNLMEEQSGTERTSVRMRP